MTPIQWAIIGLLLWIDIMLTVAIFLEFRK